MYNINAYQNWYILNKKELMVNIILIERKANLTLEKIDILKVTMMFIVVFGHSIALWLENGWFNQPPAYPSVFLTYLIGWINTIHIYAFTFASGYLFYFVKSEKHGYKNKLPSAIQRAKRLLVPYIITSLFWAIPIYVLFNGFKIKEICKRFILATNPEQLWFLIMLFWVFCFFLILSDIIEKINSAVFFIFCFIVYTFGVWIGPKLLPNVFQIWTSCRYILFFYLGYWYRKKRTIKIHPISLLIISLTFYSLFFWMLKTNKLFHMQRFFMFFTCVSGAIMVANAFSCISERTIKIVTESQFYLFFKKHSMSIYLFHQQVIYFVVNILNGKVTNIVMITSSFLISISISSIIAIVLSHFSLTRKLFGYEKF